MTASSSREILVTSALPYANGDIHLGHALEYIQTDIWVRFLRHRGHQCTWVWASDAHGTPIMLRAQKEGIEPQTLIDRYKDEHEAVFRDLGLSFDNFHTTHSEENRELAESIYLANKKAGNIEVRTIKQLYDPEKQMFLPDRFVKGTCPNCGAEDQYGDNCENCAATYDASELINPRAVESGATPELRDSEQYFFTVSQFETFLREWMDGEGRLQAETRNKIEELFESGLQDWDISRNAPYWGFKIPETENKFFYVWMDAPIGYLASHKNLCAKTGDNFDRHWAKGSSTELYHIIGKDISRFHTVFWPALLEGAGLRTPDGVFVHGFVTVDGYKMSKSRGTFINARTYLNHLDPAYLRYYYAAKLNNRVDDLDLNLEDFVARVNSDLIGKVVNIASRCAGFIKKRFDGKLSSSLPDLELYHELVDAGEGIACDYETREFSKAIRTIMSLADKANQYIADAEPWVVAKQEGQDQLLQDICTQGLNMFRIIVNYLAPVLPELAEKSKHFLNDNDLQWADTEKPLLDHAINKFKPMYQRVETKQVEAMLEATKAEFAATEVPTGPLADNPIREEIDFKAFEKPDMRVAEVLVCETVEGSDKLLRFELDLGGEKRQIFSGIKAYYPNPAELVGKMVIVVANLKPRKMRFGVSEGMILSAADDNQLLLLSADSGASPGMQVG